MAGGLIQLVAYGIQDVFLTSNPQITFFKMIYRRYSNFSMEPIPQRFNTDDIQFGKKLSCTISRTGDLIGKIYLVLDLPEIPQFVSKNSCDSIFRFAWARKIGFCIIKTIEIEIGGELIDRQYGEWMNIWYEVTNNNKYSGFDKMIGNIPELTSFTNGKKEYRLYVPLQLWFCKHTGLSLPIVALSFNEVKINVELEDINKCCIIGPTNYIDINNAVVHYTLGEFIQQKVGSHIAMGIFIDFDITIGRLYYVRATDTPFISFATSSVNNISVVNFDEFSAQYVITGLCSNYKSFPKNNVTEKNIKSNFPLDSLSIPEAFLDVQYIYLDTEERFRIMNTAHEYLIEQVQLGSTRSIQQKQFELQLSLNHPHRALFWTCQLGTCINVNDKFNYTNSVVRDLNTDKLCGKNLVTNSVILLNGTQRLQKEPGMYFNLLHPYQYFPTGPSEGINVFNFGLDSTSVQPSGTCNMSKIDYVNINIEIDQMVLSYLGSKATVKVYGLSYNILRIINGISGLLFNN